MFAAYGIQSNSGGYFNSSGIRGIYLALNHFQTFAEVFYFTNAANSAHAMTLNTLGSLTIPVVSGEINIAGGRGAGICISKNSGPGAAFYCHHPSASTTFFDCTGATRCFEFSNDRATVWSPRLILQNGSASAPGLVFLGSGGNGMYYNPAGTIELGARFDTGMGRSIIRVHTGQPLVDFLVADYYMFAIGPWPNIRVTGHFAPVSANSYYCGEPTLAWYQAFSYHGWVTTSDIRSKDVHGKVPDDILDIIDSIEPLITSSKEEDYDNKHKLIDKTEFLRKFPSFSAQEIREKIDEKLGIQTVFGDEKLGLDYGRLTPLLWQAIRRLNARLKQLES